MAPKIRLILASASPRRRQLLKKLRIPFRVMPSHIPETSAHKHPVRLVEELALRKAREIVRRLAERRSDERRLDERRLDERRLDERRLDERRSGERRSVERRYVILGADTVVVLRGKILGKPKDARDAARMLGRLSGSTHQVYTGVALVDAATGKSVAGHARSDVRMKKIAGENLARLSGRHLDKAGSYAIQEKRDPIARVVKGSYDNVVGLPVGLVRALLKKLSRDV
jgi:septum formation protein